MNAHSPHNVLFIDSIKSSHVQMHNTSIFKRAKKHSHKAMIPGTTELDMGDMSADLCIGNILDQKVYIFEPEGKVIWPKTCIKREVKISS